MKTRMAEFSGRLWRRTAFWRTGPGLAILAAAIFGLRLGWLQVQRPAHLEINAAAYGSIRDFYGEARMNHDGSRFIYAAPADDRGRVLFLCDTATGTKRQLMEDKQGVGIWNDDFNVQAGPWSPDDSRFLCVVSNRLMVCSPDTNSERVVVGDKPFTEAVWLTSAKFAYVTEENSLCMAQKREDGKWEHAVLMSRKVPMTSLTAISPDTVAWLENGEVICRANLSDGNSGAGILPASGGGTPSQPPIVPPTNGLALRLDMRRTGRGSCLSDLRRQTEGIGRFRILV